MNQLADRLFMQVSAQHYAASEQQAVGLPEKEWLSSSGCHPAGAPWSLLRMYVLACRSWMSWRGGWLRRLEQRALGQLTQVEREQVPARLAREVAMQQTGASKSEVSSWGLPCLLRCSLGNGSAVVVATTSMWQGSRRRS